MERDFEYVGETSAAMDAIVIPERIQPDLRTPRKSRQLASSPFQFSIDSVLLITTALAISLAAIVAVPEIGGIVIIFSLLVLVRTFVRTSRQAHLNPAITWNDKILAYGDSLIATFMASFVFFCVILVGSFVTAAVTGTANAMFRAQARFTLLEFFVQSWAILFGLAGLLATGLGAAASFWSFYWKTLPPISADEPRNNNAQRVGA